jgi:hypothetical protein
MARLEPPNPFDARSPAYPPQRGALSCPARIFLALNLSSQPRGRARVKSAGDVVRRDGDIK